MKLSTLLGESAPVTLNQPKLWHITEKANFEKIRGEAMMLPRSKMRGARYSDNRLHFFTTLDALEEIEGVVRFGGVDMDDNEVIAARENVPLVLIELDLAEVNDFDERLDFNRVWRRDEGVTENVGVWTSLPIPIDALTVVKQL